ncbi:MAG: geranylgeranyl reductase family protein [Caldithrix sp.]|nr:geranylgeranyl reductase family protein [Caldithrix sp.]
MANSNEIYDIIIIGGGPAGASAALYAQRYGLKSLLLEKDAFPRDKICGDAISGKSMNILKELKLVQKALQQPMAIVDSVTFGSPDHQQVNIPFRRNGNDDLPTGMVMRRQVFDHFLFNEAQTAASRTLEHFTVKKLLVEGEFVNGVQGEHADGQQESFYGKIVFGADGFKSVVSRETGLYEHDPAHWVVALRQYYKNVDGLDKQIELHYIDEVQPGYLWIFPADDGIANVGIGMLHQTMKDRRIDLKGALQSAVQSPAFRERFKNAEPMESPRGWNLPVGSKHRRNYGNGFLLLGDAAGLIDPFTGEGIGNALYSGRQAARTAREAIDQNDLSAEALKIYDERLWAELGDELRVSTNLQRIGRFRFLLNFVLNKAARNDEVKALISGMMADEVPKTKLANPLFYLKLFFS